MPFKRLTYITALLLALAPAMASAQRTPYRGQYDMDLSGCKRCDTGNYITPYYSIGIKYPLSSEALVKWANKTVTFPRSFRATGSVTVRFIVNCKGETSCYSVYQVDEQYKATTFPQDVVTGLVQFVKDMGKWPAGKSRDGKEVDYYAFISFRIKDGKVVYIVP